ncbi:MAG: DUF6673 family protein [Anaerotignum propionicum]|uniref:hypothetical protein n=1 Tax=Anaerotignum propionicum TaxID=28446 RepID=UPI002B217483|nr:hypothetical protein [Anaerotignum propionicum]MEA5057250.1 DUF6673 family protein [Anaerotignum propionicum]
MAGIKINTGIIRLEVDCDGVKDEISFNPNDVIFMENIYRLMSELEKKKKAYEETEQKLNANTGIDENGIPVNMKERLSLISDICFYIKGQIDEVFGVGTSKKLFGNANTLDMFEQFFDGITPYIQSARESKLSQYKNSASRNVML